MQLESATEKDEIVTRKFLLSPHPVSDLVKFVAISFEQLDNEPKFFYELIVSEAEGCGPLSVIFRNVYL